jgi:hypothetical protein
MKINLSETGSTKTEVKIAATQYTKVSETDKAYKLNVSLSALGIKRGDNDYSLDMYFPKSQVRVSDDDISMPEWLYEKSKVRAEEELRKRGL